jgi:hypothetical protein
MIQDATVSREEERIPSLLHTKPSGRRRRASQFCVSRGDTQGGGEGAAALDNERPQGGGGSLPYSIRCGGIQGGGADAAASSQMTQGGGEGHLMP